MTAADPSVERGSMVAVDAGAAVGVVLVVFE